MLNKPEILDCTLRDGSYVNNFQFTKYDTKKIINVLESSGIKFIEIYLRLALYLFDFQL